MSENDLPKRLEKYGGDHVLLNRVAVIKPDLMVLPTFPASDKQNDSRYPWFVRTYGDPDDLKRPVEERVSQCCELDAMDPNMLRDLVEEEIKLRIEPVAWARCETVNKAEQESLRTVLDIWKGAKATA